MMQKREATENWYRELYIKYDIFRELNEFGHQGPLLQDALDDDDLYDGIKCLNTMAMCETMYPKVPFVPLTYTGIDYVKCVIIGGMPDPENLENWIGSGYSYNQNGYTTILHKKIVEDIHGKFKYAPDLEADLYKMQSSGVLIMHEAMSVTREHYHECRTFWQPIIFRVLNHISRNDASVPIVFTTQAAMNCFKPAVLSSNHIYCLRFNGTTQPPATPEVFELVQFIANIGKQSQEKIDLLKLITK